MADIEIIDPRHPLFGRHFAVHSVSHALNSPGFVRVIYRDWMILHIPLAATTLAAQPLATTPTKLTTAAIAAVVQLAEDCEGFHDYLHPPCSVLGTSFPHLPTAGEK